MKKNDILYLSSVISNLPIEMAAGWSVVNSDKKNNGRGRFVNPPLYTVNITYRLML